MKTRAAVLSQMGLPAPYADSKPIRLEDVELDGPAAGEVLVEMVSSGVCHSDLSVVDGSRPWNVPLVLGHEASGIVRDTGPEVHDLKPSDRVVFSYVPVCGGCVLCASGRGWLCENGLAANRAGTLLGGGRRFRRSSGGPLYHHLGVSGFSQFTVASQASLVKVDGDLPPDLSALFGCAVMTGVGAVINTAKVEPGASVAVFGLGGVGLAAVMGAVAVGASTILALDLLDAKLAIAKTLGATHVFRADSTDVVQAIKDITRGGVQYAFECAGSPKALELAYQCTRRGGTTVTAGLPHPSKTITLSAVSLTAEERTLKGSYMGSCVPKRDIPRFIQMYRAGRLPVEALHTRSIRLDDLNEAFDVLARGEAVRQVVRYG
jgi:alcohol dehydrogenase